MNRLERIWSSLTTNISVSCLLSDRPKDEKFIGSVEHSNTSVQIIEIVGELKNGHEFKTKS